MNKLAGDTAALSLHRTINQTSVPYPDDCGIKEIFEGCAARHPGHPAVIGPDRTLSYRELNGLGNALAIRLAGAGVRAGSTVGICVRRSPELIVGLVAIIKCAAAYLPIDDSWPDERLRGMLAEAGARVVLSDRADSLGARLSGLATLPAEAAEPAADPPDLAVRCHPDDIAYINFTSGSTGYPRGVPARHRGVTRLVFGARYARLDPSTRTLHLSPASFDAATFEIWGSLLHGGTCVLYPPGLVRLSELKRVLDRHAVTVLFLTTALFNTVLDEAPETLDGVPTILTGGEAHSIKHIDRALRRYGAGRVVSVYGPTECTTFATYYPITEPPSAGSALPIGLPIQNTRLYVVADGRLCGPGETGELWLAGAGLSAGYLGAPRESADRFSDYEIDGVVERLYRTGDRGSLRDDGNVVFRGRLDDQVKINGFRIELGEVSHHIDRHPGVKQSYVTVTTARSGENQLVAFVVPGDTNCGESVIRRHLREALPRYMVPARVHLCAAFPLSSTGKVNRTALLSAHDLAGAPGS